MKIISKMLKFNGKISRKSRNLVSKLAGNCVCSEPLVKVAKCGEEPASLCAWLSEGFFPGGPQGDFSKIFPGGEKVVKFGFTHSKLGKQSFFAEIFKNQGRPRPPCPLPTPMAL